MWGVLCRAPCKPFGNLAQVRCSPGLWDRGMHAEQRCEVQAAGRMSDKAMPEWAPFAATLAKRMARMVKARALAPGDALWGLALDHVLLRAVDTEMQARLSAPAARLWCAAVP